MMFFGSNAGHWPVDNPVHQPVDSCGQEEPQFPQAIHKPDGAELLWPNDFGATADRLTLLDELLAERFGAPKTSRRKSEQQRNEGT